MPMPISQFTRLSMLGALALVALAACRDDHLLDPGEAGSRSVSAASFEEGCARLEVRLRGRNSIEVVAGDDACGGVRPVVVGTPEFDRVSGTVRLPLALENGGGRILRGPGGISAHPDSASVLEPSGLARNRHSPGYLQFPEADSVDGAGLYHWSVGTPATRLAPGERTTPRWIEIAVHQGVERFRISLNARMARQVAEIPAAPPTGIPASVQAEIYAADNVVSGAPYMTGTFPRDVVVVAFRRGTQRAQKQEAVELLGAEVIGGAPISEQGFYYLRIAHDGTIHPLFTAIDLLEGLPQVELVTPDLRFVLTEEYRKPNDGATWRRTDWVLDTARVANTERWGLESIAAPFAWGCATGDSLLRIGVVDGGFFRVDDLTPNTLASSDFLGVPGGNDHGTKVASILAARGGNDRGMTGVMSHARLRLYDVGAGSGSPWTRMVEAATDGSSIINFSMGLYWQRFANRRPAIYIPGSHPDTIRADSAVARSVGASAYLTLRAIADTLGAAAPLVVFSAGNDGVDGWWNGKHMALDSADVRDFVIAVAANDRARALGSFSNRNETTSLIQISAPGVQVGALDRSLTANVVRVDGTSFAAPHVAGTAGLLKSLDPRLTGAEMKQLLLRGARRGAHAANGIPILNAFESLKIVGERPGAALCGNPVYRSSAGALMTRRDSLWTTEQTLAPSIPAGEISPLHGGHQIRLASGSGFRWDPAGGWVAVGAIADTSANATNLSRAGRSHEGNRVVTAVKRAGPNPRYDEIWDVYVNGTLLKTIDHHTAPKVNTGYAVPRCVKWLPSGNEFSTCVAEWPVNHIITSSHAVSFASGRGAEGEVVLAVALSELTLSVDLAAYHYGGYFQRNHESQARSVGTHLYFIDVRTGAVRRELVGIFDVRQLAFSDDGERIALNRNFRWLNISFTALGTNTLSTRYCDVGYMRVGRPSGMVRMFSTPIVRDQNLCYEEATFAP